MQETEIEYNMSINKVMQFDRRRRRELLESLAVALSSVFLWRLRKPKDGARSKSVMYWEQASSTVAAGPRSSKFEENVRGTTSMSHRRRRLDDSVLGSTVEDGGR